MDIKKTEFTYQRFFLRHFCLLFIFPINDLIRGIVINIFNLKSVTFWFILFCCSVSLTSIFFYYKYTENKTWFYRKGYYWVENNIVYVQRRKKIYKLDNIHWLRGTTSSIYGNGKSGMLVAQSTKTKLVLFSTSTTPIENFSDCELFPLFEKILELNPELKKEETLDFWYEKIDANKK